MKVIAHRKGGIFALYLFTLILGIVLMFLDGEAYVIMKLCGLAVIAISLYILIGYLRTPKEPIKLIGDDTLQLPGDLQIPVSKIVDVSYFRASARGIQYRWGSVTIATGMGTCKVKYVADCEAVAKRITQLMYEARR